MSQSEDQRQNTGTSPVESSALLGVNIAQNEIQNASKTPDIHTAESQTVDKEPLMTFAEWLHALDQCPSLLNLVAKTSQSVEKISAMLIQWKSAGCPDPGDWPEQIRHLALPRWILRSECSPDNLGSSYLCALTPNYLFALKEFHLS
jgi:hypothetical protein